MRYRAQRKARKAALAAITQEEMADRQLRFAIINHAIVHGEPALTGWELYRYRNQVTQPGEFRRALFLAMDKEDPRG